MVAGCCEWGEQGAEVEVVEIELVAAVGVGRVDPLSAAEEPAPSIAVWKSSVNTDPRRAAFRVSRYEKKVLMLAATSGNIFSFSEQFVDHIETR